MGLLSSVEISASALTAQRRRLEVIISNLANASTTRTPEGGPYRRRDVVFTSAILPENSDSFADSFRDHVRGVAVADVMVDNSPLERKYDPGHPDADAQGYVEMPNVNPIEEMANLLSAVRSFQASLAAINSAKELAQRSLEIIK